MEVERGITMRAREFYSSERRPNKRRWFKQKVAIGLVAGFLASMLLGWDQSSQGFSFDNLFPQTWYGKALRACTQVWADLDALSAVSGTQGDSNVMLDVSIGRLVFSSYCLIQLYDNERDKHPVSDDDLAYLNQVVRTLEACGVKLQDLPDQDRVRCMQTIIAGVKKRIKHLFQANNARCSAN